MSIAARPRTLAAASLVGAAVLALGTWGVFREARRHTASNDPRLTYASPFRNVRPEVGYVGDASCAACHPAEAATFRDHPMGRSLGPIATAPPVERYGPDARNPFTLRGIRYAVEHHGDQVFHQELQPDPTGQAPVVFRAEVKYALGSGKRGRSYLIDHDGYVFQSAISWYTQAQSWALAPGLESHPHSERRITLECLFCHCNATEQVPDTTNRFREPLFQGYTIGCERCHGPGELHARLREEGQVVRAVDESIVNPAHLAPALREAVCQQCHLQGQVRVLHHGRQPFDYRPGLPWELFWSVFVPQADLHGSTKAVGQVEQMYASRCFRASEGRLGCISCHDPHATPAPENRVTFYRDRCLRCHTASSCTEAKEARQHAAGDDCTACHMPKMSSSDVAHTALSDHRVLRRPREEGARSAAPGGTVTLVPFHADPKTEESGNERDLGLALMERAEWGAGDRMALWFDLGKAHRMLEAATHANPKDVDAWQGDGRALRQLGRREAALTALEKALALAPGREQTLEMLARLTAEMTRPADARAYWRRALAVNPWFSDYHHEYQKLLAQECDWSAAIEEGKAVQRLDPFNRPAQVLLVESYLAVGRKVEARAEWLKLRALSPEDAAPLQTKVER
jgi:predicted CXXCH cytochrome family protein